MQPAVKRSTWSGTCGADFRFPTKAVPRFLASMLLNTFQKPTLNFFCASVIEFFSTAVSCVCLRQMRENFYVHMQVTGSFWQTLALGDPRIRPWIVLT